MKKKKFILPVLILMSLTLIIYFYLPSKIIINSKGGSNEAYIENSFVKADKQYEIYGLDIINNHSFIPIKITGVYSNDKDNFLNLQEVLITDNIGLITVKDDTELNNLRLNKEISSFYKITTAANSTQVIGLLLKVNKSIKINSSYSNLRPSEVKVKFTVLGIPYTKSISLNHEP